MSGSVKQQRIAEELNLSRATVSRCFTNHPGISPVTRAKVFKLASELGYDYMETRVSSKEKKVAKKPFGVLICVDKNDYQDERLENLAENLIAGLSEYAQINERHIEMHFVEPQDKSLDDPSYSSITALKRRKWDGVILIYPFPKEIVSKLHDLLPLVSLVEQYEQSNENCVDVDHRKGVAALINRLVDLGHREIGFLTRHYEVEANWSYRRYAAYVEKMTRLGYAIDSKNVVNVDDNQRLSLGESHAYVLERVKSGVKAWVCASDSEAYDLIAHLEKNGGKCLKTFRSRVLTELIRLKECRY